MKVTEIFLHSALHLKPVGHWKSHLCVEVAGQSFVRGSPAEVPAFPFDLPLQSLRTSFTIVLFTTFESLLLWICSLVRMYKKMVTNGTEVSAHRTTPSKCFILIQVWGTRIKWNLLPFVCSPNKVAIVKLAQTNRGSVASFSLCISTDYAAYPEGISISPDQRNGSFQWN